jgi:hypothetical protein
MAEVAFQPEVNCPALVHWGSPEDQGRFVQTESLLSPDLLRRASLRLCPSKPNAGSMTLSMLSRSSIGPRNLVNAAALPLNNRWRRAHGTSVISAKTEQAE